MVNFKQKVERIERVGGGRGHKDTSDDLQDMTFAEKLLMDRRVLNGLQDLPVMTYKNKKDYPYATTDRRELAALGDPEDGPYLSGAMSKMNQVFVAMNEAGYNAPYRALSTATKHTYTIPIIVSKGTHKGETRHQRVHDLVVIYKYGEEFNPTEYAIPGGRVSKGGNPDQKYEVPSPGMEARVKKWLVMHKYIDAETEVIEEEDDTVTDDDVVAALPPVHTE